MSYPPFPPPRQMPQQPRAKAAPDPRLAAYERVRQALDLPAGCDPAAVARAVEETLSSYAKLAGQLGEAMEDYPARMPTITQA